MIQQWTIIKRNGRDSEHDHENDELMIVMMRRVPFDCCIVIRIRAALVVVTR